MTSTIMSTTEDCAHRTIRLPRFNFWRVLGLFRLRNRRRQVTIDLIHSSPHLLRDIGAVDGRIVERGR